VFIQKRHLAVRADSLTSLYCSHAMDHKIVAVLAETAIYNF